MSSINSKLDFVKNKESTISMGNAGWSSSTHSEEFPGLAHCKLQSARDKPENRLRVGPLLSRPETYGLSMGHLKNPGIKGFTSHLLENLMI